MHRISPASGKDAGTLYRTIWRWHFYAGLFVLPFILILSVTGAIYLFKPQIDRWEERAFQRLSMERAVSPDVQLQSVMATYPTGRMNYYRLPERAGDATMLQLGFFNGDKLDVFVSPQGKLLGTRDPATKFTDMVASIHGSLLLGTWGDWLVELAASWTIVLILSGIYLWWPRPFRVAGIFYPRLTLKGRPLLKDIHRVSGFWIAGLVLVMLASGLPWASAWGSAFKWARTELGLIEGTQDWKIGGKPAEAVHHHHGSDSPAAMDIAPIVFDGQPLAAFVAKARAEQMAFPVLVLPPHSPQRFGLPTGDDWTIKSETQNRPLARQVTYDAKTAAETGRRGFGDRHVIDRVVNTGIAWHEGQLFGLANQLLGLFTAIALVGISVLGVVMWLKRRPVGRVGAPSHGGPVPTRRLAPVLVVLALLLPLFGATLVALLLVDAIYQRTRRILVKHHIKKSLYDA